MTARSSSYMIYVVAYNRLRGRMYAREKQIHCARNLLSNGECDTEESREYILADITRMEREVACMRKRMSFLESTAEMSGWDLTKFRRE